MKYQILFFTLVIHLAIIAQTSNVIGTYDLRLESSNALIVDTLILHSDKTFVYHSYDKHDGGIPPERNFYGKGTWTFEKNIIHLSSNKDDFDEKYTLDFNNSKARFITKSPRDKSDRVIPTSLQFYKSEIFWIPKRNLIKK
jgi:hypothetical protein